MFGTTTITQKTKRTGTGAKARKLILALGILGVAGIGMAAAPAMAHDEGRDHDRGRETEHREYRDVHERDYDRHEFREHEYREHEFRDREVRIWIPARYEDLTYIQHGCPITVQVCIEPGHWELR